MTTNLNIADDLELYMLELVNAARAEHGLHALQLEQHLNLAAELHSEWMLEENVFSHTGVNGTSAHDRIVDAGFDLGGQWWTGENLAVGSADNDNTYTDEIDTLFEGLMNSPGHRANILSENYDYIGIGIEVDWFVFPNNQGNWFSVMATQTFGATGGDVLLDNGYQEPEPDPQPDPDPQPEPQPDPDPVTPPSTEDMFVEGDDGNDNLAGGSGDDEILGYRGDDNLSGGDGNDVIKGGIGDDTIDGGAGNDTLTGGSGADIITGGSGINKLVGQAGDDMIYGGDERDILNGGGGSDYLQGGDGNDRLKGGFNDDVLYGGDGPDKLYANNGNDSLFGGSGDDLLNAGGGTDWLVGGSGDDRIKGGADADTFVFVQGGDADRIVDFSVGEDVLLIHSGYWDTGESAADLIDDHATVEGNKVVIDFGGGQEIVLQGVTSLDGLADSIDMI